MRQAAGTNQPNFVSEQPLQTHQQNQNPVRKQVPRTTHGLGEGDLYQKYEMLKREYENRMNVVKQEFTSQLDELIAQHLKGQGAPGSNVSKENALSDDESIGSEIGTSPEDVNPKMTSIRRADMDGSISTVELSTSKSYFVGSDSIAAA